MTNETVKHNLFALWLRSHNESDKEALDIARKSIDELEALKKGIGEMWELLREPPHYIPNIDAYNRCLDLVFKYVDSKDEIVVEVNAEGSESE